MRLPRPRITVRRLMVAVAVVGLLMALFHRRATFLEAESRHFSECYGLNERAALLHMRLPAEDPTRRARQSLPPLTPEQEGRIRREIDQVMAVAAYHRKMSEKYERAARSPWLPVEADTPPPPEPE